MDYTNILYRSPITLSRLAMAGIAIDGFLGIVEAVFGFMQIALPMQTIDLDEASPMSMWALLQTFLAFIQFPVYIFSIVAFLLWLYRAYTNLPALRSDNMEFSPGWAVGWWFIPFANLVKPFQAVRTLWSESDPAVSLDKSFLSHIQAGAPAFMSLWWAFWLLSNFAANAAGRLFDPDNPTSLQISAYLFVLSGLLTAGAAALVIKVIVDITERQEQRFKNIGIFQVSTPPPPPTFVPGQ